MKKGTSNYMLLLGSLSVAAVYTFSLISKETGMYAALFIIMATLGAIRHNQP